MGRIDDRIKREELCAAYAEANIMLAEFGAYGINILETDNALRQGNFKEICSRLAYADEVLTSSQDLEERFLAAFVLDLDGEQLAAQLQLPGLFIKPDIAAAAAEQAAAMPDFSNAEQLRYAQEVREHLTHGRKVAGVDLLIKSRLLFTGLHWWFRGRYGAGSEGNGLLKDKLALTSPQAMFGLYVPKETPKPTDPTVYGLQSPQIDRRHHYLWQFETKRIATSFSSGVNKSQEKGDLHVVQRTTFGTVY